jgi:hypothetical protein
MTRSDNVIRVLSEEIARWVVSGVVGGCIAVWSTVLTIFVSPTILDLSARGFLRFYFYSAGFASILFYLVFARRFGR